MSKRITDRVVLDVLEAAHTAPGTPVDALARRYGGRTVQVILGQLAERGLLERTVPLDRAVPTERGRAVLAEQRPHALFAPRDGRLRRALRRVRPALRAA